MSFNDSFAGYLLFEIMMRVLNNKIEKMKKAVRTTAGNHVQER